MSERQPVTIPKLPEQRKECLMCSIIFLAVKFLIFYIVFLMLVDSLTRKAEKTPLETLQELAYGLLDALRYRRNN